jgi:pimeloyl-ACP methyl ester carboxylesterase
MGFCRSSTPVVCVAGSSRSGSVDRPGSVEIMLDASVTLSDGRLLAYTDLGAPGGPVVMYCHGAPTSRLDLSGFEHAFAERGVRVVSADRPGYGGSSPQPGRRLEDWPSDVAALADHLGVERFAVMAWSSGGPYAVACAALLPGRVASAGIVAGVTDFGWPGAWNGYVEDEVTLMRIGDEAGAVKWCEDRYGADGSGLMETGLGELAPADQAALQDEARATALMTTVGEALRQGIGGYAQDITLQGRPWSFGAPVIDTPVWILHGEADTVVPVAHARHTAELITGARLSTWPAEGHISVLTKIPDLTADLVAQLH